MFNNILTEILTEITKDFQRIMESVTSGKMRYMDMMSEIKQSTDKIGRMISKSALEITDKVIKEDKKRKKEWVVEREDDRKIVTIFGEIEFARTYYKSKKGEGYSYLLDKYLEIEPYDKVDPIVKIKLVENATIMSYEESSRITCPVKLTKQTVKNAIKEIGEIEKELEVGVKKEVDKIYIEADEDHVALQDGKKAMPRLVYIHEGKEIKEGQERLKNIYYMTWLEDRPEDIWLKVADYIYNNYEIDKIKKIYIAGDGAKWIKEGLNWVDKAKFVLDKYHINKYITRVTGDSKEYREYIWEAIKEGNKDRVRKLFNELLKTSEEKAQGKIRETKNYIINNWEGIKIYSEDKDVIGCSAEGHISHVLSARLSSRPLGWSKEGLKLMAKLRVFKANGGDILEYYWHKPKKIESKYSLSKAKINKVKKEVQKAVNEQLNNIPVFSIGKVTPIYNILKNIQYKYKF